MKQRISWPLKNIRKKTEGSTGHRLLQLQRIFCWFGWLIALKYIGIIIIMGNTYYSDFTQNKWEVPAHCLHKWNRFSTLWNFWHRNIFYHSSSSFVKYCKTIVALVQVACLSFPKGTCEVITRDKLYFYVFLLPVLSIPSDYHIFLFCFRRLWGTQQWTPWWRYTDMLGSESGWTSSARDRSF